MKGPTMNRIDIYGPIGWRDWDGQGTTAQDVVDALATMSGDVEVHVNSYGGLASDGVAIHNALKAYDGGKVTVIVDAMAASAASVIAIAGRPTVMAEGAMLMVHDPATITLGNEADHLKAAGVLGKLSDTYAALYARRSGQKPKAVRAMMQAETWFTADEAVAEGFADESRGLAEGETAIEPVAFDWRLFRRAPDRLRAQSRPAPVATHQEFVMSTTPIQKTAPAEPTPSVAPSPAPIAAAPTAAALGEALAADRARAREIRAMVAAARLDPAVADGMIDDGTTVADAKGKLFDMIAAADPQTMALGERRAPNAAPARVTLDAVDKFVQGAELALMAKIGLAGGERNEFSSLRLGELARMSLSRRGIDRTFTDQMQMIGAAFRPTMAGGMHSTSDFGNILANVANKSLLKAYEETEDTFQIWTAKGRASDFKLQTRVGINLFPSLGKVLPGAQYNYATVGDRKATAIISTYGNLFAVTRQAIINDDLDLLDGIPKDMGRAAKRTIGNLVYAILTDNAALADGIALFHASHGNLGTAAAPATASFEEARMKMARQKDPDSIATALNIRPAYILAPVAVGGRANVVVKSETEILSGQANSKVPNSVQGLAQVITDARLDDASTTAWYMAADPARFDTIEVLYLDGVETPTLENKDGWSIDGTEFKVRMDAGVAVLDYRGLLKNAGS